MGAPPLGRISKQTQRDLRSRNGKFAQLSAAYLRQILDDAARGKFEDFADFCDRMVREDPHVRATYETRLSAVAAARYMVEPGGLRTPLDAAFAAFCEETLRELRTSQTDWSMLDDVNLAMRLLDGIGVGYSVVELDWRPTSQGWRPVTAYWVHQRRFIFDDDWKLKIADTGDAIHSDGLDLPPDKFIVHIPQSIAGYPTQTGICHAIAWPFFFSRWGEQWWFDGQERMGWGTPYLKQDADAHEDTKEAGVTFLDRMTQGVSAVLPVGTELAIFESAVKDSGTFNAYLKRQDERISKAILGVSDVTEPGKVGAWKAVESRTGTNVEPRMSLDAQCLASTYKSQLFEPLRRHNPRFAGAALPTIRWMISAERKDIAPHVIAAGVVTVNELRASAGLPPVPGGERLVSAPAQSAPQTPAEPEPATPSPPAAQEPAQGSLRSSA